jgi:hypothetical protein
MFVCTAVAPVEQLRVAAWLKSAKSIPNRQ